MDAVPSGRLKEFDEKHVSISSEEKLKQKNITNISLDELLLETENFLRQLDSGAFVSNISDHRSEPILPKTLSMFDHFPKLSSGSNRLPSPSQSSIIILLQVVFSAVGHVQRPSSKFVALILSKLSNVLLNLCLSDEFELKVLLFPSQVHRIALVSTDEIRLQRIVPFVTSLLQDSESIIRASGISVLASVLSGKLCPCRCSELIYQYLSFFSFTILL
jgi:phosphoinositide-3-kinase regulatory subunit 4